MKSRLIERKYSTIFLIAGIGIILWSFAGKYQFGRAPMPMPAMLAMKEIPPKPLNEKKPKHTIKQEQVTALAPKQEKLTVEVETNVKRTITDINWYELIDKFAHILGWIVTAISAYNLVKKKKEESKVETF